MQAVNCSKCNGRLCYTPSTAKKFPKLYCGRCAELVSSMPDPKLIAKYRKMLRGK